MRRRELLIAAFALSAAFRARAQVSAVPRIGMLDPSPSQSSLVRLAELRAGLKALGLEEGRHYAIEYRSAEGRFDRLSQLAAELVQLQVRVIVARNTPGVLAARGATSRVPIVMADVGDPLNLGFVKSLAAPGGNITGPSNATLELVQKRFEMLREMLPSLRRVAVLGNPADQNTPYQVAEANRAARTLAAESRVFDARDEARLDAALRDIAAWKPDAVLPLVNPLYRSIFSPRLIAWAPRLKLPVMHAFRDEVEAGGLIAYAADLTDHYQRVASYVQRLLAGGDAATLAVERPTRFELVLNLKTARTIGIAMPQPVLVRADRVIE